MTIHFPFGGSTAARTLACSAWRKAADRLPPPVESEYAKVGTALHACEETLLLDDRVDPFEFRDADVLGVHITHEMITEKLQPAFDAWRQLIKQYDIIEYEPELLVQVDTDIGGTLDVIGIGDEHTVIVDWKFGDGVQVYPEENAQALFYAMCVDGRRESLEDLIRDKLVLAIIQPTSKDDPTLRVWETDWERVDAFAREHDRAVALARNADPDNPEHYTPGPHCRFCPVEATCPAKTGLVEQARRLDPQHIPTITGALKVADEMEKWIAAVRKCAHEQLEQGTDIPGYKLVHKRPTRVWNDPDRVEQYVRRQGLLKEALPRKMLSPAQMEKLFKQHDKDVQYLDQWISSVSSGTTLAPASDSRPAAPALKALQGLARRTG